MRIENHEIIVTNKLIKTARVELEYDEDIADPASFIDKLKNHGVRADIFTFCQRVPESRPKYDYHTEWSDAAVISVDSYSHWWEKQIDAKTRNMARKAEKRGVVIKVIEFDDAFVKGIESIYNETPVRQGKPFWHYGKDFNTLKEIHSGYLDRSDFIGAYLNDELLGFIWLIYGKNTARMVQIISKIEHRDKAPANALVAKAVELCDIKKIPYLIYGVWSEGTLGDFKKSNGFKKIDLPRYYVPLTIKGKAALKLNAHRGLKNLIPKNIKHLLKDLRTKWYSRRYKKNDC